MKFLVLDHRDGTPTDRDLPAVVNDLFEKHAEKVYRFALSLSRDVHTAEDLTQETFLRAIRTKSPLKDSSREKPWLFQILVNVWRDRQRRSNRDESQLSDSDPPGNVFAPEQLAIQTEQKKLILQAMSKLPDQQRNALHLRSVEQLSISEIANLLDSNTNAVKANLSVARKKMRSLLAGQIVDVGAKQ